jgi:hypothetical protein
MKPQSLHAHEDRLLDFVYGELPPQEARAVESHLEGCSRCSQLLDGIRGVRTTMAQLPMEPAPDAGLESLLAYAQQAARNTAAGPAPKPTWWRRWLVPVMGVAAVCTFGIVSIQVNKSVELGAERAVKAESEAVASMAPAPRPEPAKATPEAYEAPPPPPPSNAMAGLTPPQSAPAAKLDDSFLQKEAPRQKAFAPTSKGARADWSNAGGLGSGTRDELSEDNLGDTYAAKPSKKKSGKSYEYDRRDAMTQAGAFPKPKPVAASSAPEGAAGPATPAPAEQPAAQAAMDGEGDGNALVAEAQVQQAVPSRDSLRVGGSMGRTRGAEADEQPADVDDARAMEERAAPSAPQREQVQLSTAEPLPPPAAASTSMPSVRTAPPRPSAARRAEDKAVSSAELSKQADAALRSGDRVQEAQLLRQALAAGASGKERLGLLNRLCDAEFATGRRQAAIEACSLVLKEDPRSSAAQAARSRLRREAPEADNADAQPSSRDTGRASEMKAPAPAAPAEAR